MKAVVSFEPGRIEVVSKPMPDVGPNGALIGPWAAGLGDHKINTALRPRGTERMRRLLNMGTSGRLDLGLLHSQPNNRQLAFAHD